MIVCLCTGATTQVVNNAITAGASTSTDVAAACGAGAVCGRCRRTLRALIAAHPTQRPPDGEGRTVPANLRPGAQAPRDDTGGDRDS
jgi:bacterioferritin-associated ferredoxin